ncbi:hypothetical protein KEM54_004404 [Ascosphaera aggregata]|nr:hypothetical protein KEM54_004404 [Ascosphaera aggregata]
MFYKEEIPTTYLNKGQTYMLKVVNKTPLVSGSLPVKYVTSIRISFEDDDLRSKAVDCWRLWKTTRSRSVNGDSRERKKQWLAVELANGETDPLHHGASSPAMSNTNGHHDNLTRPQLLSSQSDGFTVAWAPCQSFATNVQQECLIPIRFNFLSTDSMPSKGVKGAPMRLCVKTKVSQSGTPTRTMNAHRTAQHVSPTLPTNFFGAEHQASENLIHSLDETTNETWYCKLQAFRDHGAERKFQNQRQQIENAFANSTAKLANLLNGLKNGGNILGTGSDSSPSSDPGAGGGTVGVGKVIKRRKCAGSADLIYRLQGKIDALRFALNSAEDCIMLTMTSWNSDDDPDVVRP